LYVEWEAELLTGHFQASNTILILSVSLVCSNSNARFADSFNLYLVLSVLSV